MTIHGHSHDVASTQPVEPTDELTPANVADMLQIDVGRVYTMAQRGQLPQVDNGPGPRLRFSRVELEAWLRQK